MRGLFCQQPNSVGDISRILRWFIFINCLIETALWSGNIFGWASLVHVLKMRGVYSSLCDDTSKDAFENFVSGNYTISTGNSTTHTTSDPVDKSVSLGCVGQDEQFALVSTVSMVLYSTPGILVGYALHHLGLAFTRVIAGLMLSVGYILLSLTRKETSDYLFGAAILISVGGNTIRMAGLEFGNLFPKQRSTVMAMISSMYTISAALFVVLQSVTEAGYSWRSICLILSAATMLIVVITPLVPRHHIPYVVKTTGSGSTSDKGVSDNKEVIGQPLSQSIFCLSSLLHLYWIFSCLFGVTVYGTFFNAWVTKFSKSTDEAALYSRLYGYANLFCVFIIPLPGLLMDTISSKLKKGKTGVAEKVANVQAAILPMILVTISVVVQLCCFLFFSPIAVYVSLICLIINRPSCLGVGIPFIRARFPADHFNRLIGIQGTIVSVLTLLQYPLFTWTQTNYYLALGSLVALMSLALINPLHLVNKAYLHRSLTTPEMV